MNIGSSGALPGALSHFVAPQFSQDDTNVLMYLYILGQKYLCFTSSYVLSVPKCALSWYISTMNFLSFGGITGRPAFVSMSLSILSWLDTRFRRPSLIVSPRLIMSMALLSIGVLLMLVFLSVYENRSVR